MPKQCTVLKNGLYCSDEAPPDAARDHVLRAVRHRASEGDGSIVIRRRTTSRRPQEAPRWCLTPRPRRLRWFEQASSSSSEDERLRGGRRKRFAAVCVHGLVVIGREHALGVEPAAHGDEVMGRGIAGDLDLGGLGCVEDGLACRGGSREVELLAAAVKDRVVEPQEGHAEDPDRPELGHAVHLHEGSVAEAADSEDVRHWWQLHHRAIQLQAEHGQIFHITAIHVQFLLYGVRQGLGVGGHSDEGGARVDYGSASLRARVRDVETLSLHSRHLHAPMLLADHGD
mmetsp:Transcript_74919/g.243381  ORF Transcript_74919/g.243381 Transcript_74919/m.243381 type:complete len:285 (+) Transcript_74919:112-966(+)